MVYGKRGTRNTLCTYLVGRYLGRCGRSRYLHSVEDLSKYYYLPTATYGTYYVPECKQGPTWTVTCSLVSAYQDAAWQHHSYCREAWMAAMVEALTRSSTRKGKQANHVRPQARHDGNFGVKATVAVRESFKLPSLVSQHDRFIPQPVAWHGGPGWLGGDLRLWQVHSSSSSVLST